MALLPRTARLALLSTPWAYSAAAAAGTSGIRLSIDGADEVDPDLNLVKGRSGSLLREKMVEGAGERFVVIVDESKLVPRLWCTGAVPVEVVPFGAPHTLALIRELFDGVPGFHVRLRTVPAAAKGDNTNALPFRTDMLAAICHCNSCC